MRSFPEHLETRSARIGLAGRSVVLRFASALLALASVAQATDRCTSIALTDVPPAARRSLEIEAADGPLENVCFLRERGSISFRAHGKGSGITVEVSPMGQVLRREWSGRD
jgi:hypothetical protein